ncbi:hypothetical protein TL16_g05438 [Triparma laevis f. inornata]|uniref:Calreticulin n=2 Tax=Triparma laevis TaxID=1534972 RepID=A0A9W7EC38_9STRA|nr:hypothetical protein TL16_g05438 [Triparma laevis f. inornata]GMH70753.1 hypothetical protein TrLO_g10949 [Triparma laevis f. longispina]
MKFSILTAALAANTVSAKVYFKDSFANLDAWSTSLMTGKKEADMGKWELSSGKWHGDSSDLALQTTEDARFYGISAPLDSTFDNKGKDLVIQYVVKHEQRMDCGGAYIKLLGGGKSFPTDTFGGDTPYSVMFGPDICGSATRRTHVIFNYPAKDDNLLINKDVKCETDQLSHLYTLHVKADNTFEVLIDNKSVRSGTLEEEFPFLEPKEIKDPAVSKPTDWVDERRIPNPEDKKPEGYDDISPEIPDPEAKKPDDWDEEDDGEWEPPVVSNPEFKGDWKPKMIANPDYKGEWEHPMIPNPEYVGDDALYHRCKDCTHIGFELWQVSAGTSFDDIIVTDSLPEAQAFAEETFFKKNEKEQKMYDDVMEQEREEAKRKDEEKRAKEEAEREEEEDHDEL